jgi:hypothetical protein
MRFFNTSGVVRWPEQIPWMKPWILDLDASGIVNIFQLWSPLSTNELSKHKIKS